VLRHHHLKPGNIKASGDPISGRLAMLTNDDVTMSRCRPAQRQTELYRNASADEILFIHKGKGTLHTMFGPLSFKPFDYIVIPRCVTYRIEFDAGAQPDLLVIEASGSIGIPPRYLNPDCQLRLGAPYYERDFHGPADVAVMDKEQETTVLI